ncbi:hypothetical protein DPMN_019987 [Dreissena polymorpha]|uniref:Uncharacterized protein n=1 Tax=Dreissena polymorpha TaxID=45954 RepID=A0A9D4NI00_DREPO|nr:hypothetical protein DPMN_019987 [Dreissena polymorpha]
MSIFRNLNAKCDGQTDRQKDRQTDMRVWWSFGTGDSLGKSWGDGEDGIMWEVGANRQTDQQTGQKQYFHHYSGDNNWGLSSDNHLVDGRTDLPTDRHEQSNIPPLLEIQLLTKFKSGHEKCAGQTYRQTNRQNDNVKTICTLGA